MVTSQLYLLSRKQIKEHNALLSARAEDHFSLLSKVFSFLDSPHLVNDLSSLALGLHIAPSVGQTDIKGQGLLSRTCRLDFLHEDENSGSDCWQQWALNSTILAKLFNHHHHLQQIRNKLVTQHTEREHGNHLNPTYVFRLWILVSWI